MAWVEVGWGGCSGVPPSEPHVLWGDKAQGVGQCGTGYLQPWAGSVRNRVPALQSRQGAKSSQEDRADGVRAAGGGPGGSGRLCCFEQEGMSGEGVRLGEGAAGQVEKVLPVNTASGWGLCGGTSSWMQLQAERESTGQGLLWRKGGRENWSTSLKPSWSWMWAEGWWREDARRGGGELRCLAQPAPRRPLLAGLQPRPEGVSE